MKSIVITGSTRGFGFGLASAFLNMGCAVTINGRTPQAVQAATNRLATYYDSHGILGVAGDMSDHKTAENLWKHAIERFNRVDIWINNAGAVPPQSKLWDTPTDAVYEAINANFTGMVLGSQVAMRGMIGQGYGQIYTMEGAGWQGELRRGLMIYGATKSAANYISKALQKECPTKSIQICSIHPGLVVTDMIRDHYADEVAMKRARRRINRLGDKVETVAPWVAQQVMENTKSGVRLRWLNRRKRIKRTLTAPIKRRNLLGN